MNQWTLSIRAASFVLLSALASLAQAERLATLGIVNQSTGERLHIWRHEGRNYIAGNPGERYAIEIRNRTGGRVLSVISVDGVNVVSGATAAVNQTGYVLDTWQPLEIKGWRKSMDEVAAFYFTRLPDSYAARTGRGNNVGVIGAAIFQEVVEPVREPAPESAPIREQAKSRAAAAPAPASGALAGKDKSADESIGTGHGERLASASRTTNFRRASEEPDEIISIYYDTYAHLMARGVIPRQHSKSPAPFPGSFAPDPA